MGLNPTPRDKLLDAAGRPYFLWDCELTLEEFVKRLRSEDSTIRNHYLSKLMRQAKPDDVLQFVTMAEISERLPQIESTLGKSREFWLWLTDVWPKGESAAG